MKNIIRNCRLILCLSLFTYFLPRAYAQTDQDALMAIYNATGGDNWEECGRDSTHCGTTPWLSDVDECTWYSVGCNPQGDLFQIRFGKSG